MRCYTLVAIAVLASSCKRDQPKPPAVPSDTAPEVDLGKVWTSADGVFTDEGLQLLLRGVNCPSRENTADDFAQLAGWGVNTIRLLYFWAHVEPEAGQIDEAFLEQLDGQVALAKQQGLYVLIDEHQHGYGVGFGAWGFPEWTCDEQHYEACYDEPFSYWCEGTQICFDEFWHSEELQQQYIDHLVLLAERYADEPAVIGFDVINEPFCMGDDCGQTMSEFYTKAGRQIGEVAPDKLIFIEPNFVELVGVPTVVTDVDVPNKLVYAAHYYLMEVHDGNDYDLNPRPIQANFELRKQEAAEVFDAPLFLGEFGGIAEVANFSQYIDDTLDLLDDTLAGGTYWLYGQGEGFHMLDEEGNEKPFLDTFVRPYPMSTPGLVESLSFEDSTKVMDLVFESDGKSTAPGLIFVPERHYGAGFSLTGCDAPSCTYSHDSTTQLLSLTVVEAGTYSLRLSPQ